MAENIPIRNITQSGIPSGTSYIVFDDGSMKKGLVSDLADVVRPVASQSEAQTGSDNTKTMTPLRVKDSIASEVGSTIQAHASNLDNFAGKTAPAGDVVGTTDAQTLTNKTLTAPAISSPTGLVKADVGLGNVDNTSDATKNSAAATLTNKTIDGGTNTLQNIPNAALTNSGVTISGHALALGGSLNLAAADVSGLATVATSGSYADLSGAPTLGNLAAKDKVDVPADLNVIGTPDGSKFLRDDGSWQSIPGGGDMLAANNLSDLTNADAALTELGGTSVGKAVFTATDAAAAQSAIGQPDGAVVQFASAIDATYQSGTTNFAFGDNAPTNTEGTEILTCSITPKSATNKLVIRFNARVAGDATNTVGVALFVSGTSTSISAEQFTVPSADAGTTLSDEYVMTAGTTSALTFSLRVGCASSHTWYVNGISAGRRFGGTMKTAITITEVKA